MNAPYIWILSPLILGIILVFARKWYRLTVLFGTLYALLLAGAAWLIPIGETVELGPLSFEIFESLEVFGRSFVIANQDRSLLLLIYFLAAFWFAAVFWADAGQMTVPFGLILFAILAAILAVEPFIYSALFLGLAVLVCIPILVQPDAGEYRVGQDLIRSVFRFLAYQMFGLPFLILAGWTLAGVETMPNRTILIQAVSLVGFGLVILLGIFPFHSWILMLAQNAQPYIVAFILIVFSWIGILFGLRVIDRYPWLYQIENLLSLMRLVGSFVILIAGINAAFEHHLGRMLGHAYMVELGFILIAVSFPDGLPVLLYSIIPRIAAFGTWSLALTVIKKAVGEGGLHLERFAGVIRIVPISASALILAQLSLSGLPLLASFPARLVVWDYLAVDDPWIAWVSIIGLAGLFTATIRTLVAFSGDPVLESAANLENWKVVTLQVTACCVLLILGLTPHLFLPLTSLGLHTFPNLVP